MERATNDDDRPHFRFSLLNAFILIAAIAAALATQRAFWKPRELNPTLWLTWYLLALAIITAVSLNRHVPYRASFWAAAIFGWTYFIFIMKAGYTTDLSEWILLSASVKQGFCFLGLCILISHPMFSFVQVNRRDGA